MLVGAGQLVEQRGLAAVLVAHQREGQLRALRQRVAAAPGVVLAVLAQAQVGLLAAPVRRGALGQALDARGLDLLGVRQPKRQLVAVDAQLHRVAHRRQLHQRDLRARNHAHVQKVLPQRALAAHGVDAGALPDLQIPEASYRLKLV